MLSRCTRLNFAATLFLTLANSRTAAIVPGPNGFAGKWTADPAQLQSAGSTALTASYTIALSGDSIVATRVTTSTSGPLTNRFILHFDGKPRHNTLSVLAGPPEGPSEQIDLDAMLTARIAGDTLSFSMSAEVQGSPVETKMRWVLAADGQSFAERRDASHAGQAIAGEDVIFRRQP